MYNITKFRDVTIAGLSADNGGCMFIGLDNNFRTQNFNAHEYLIQNLKLSDCIAFENGGGMHVKDVRHLSINGASEISNSIAYNSGGGIYFECKPINIDTEKVCIFKLDTTYSIMIHNNQAYSGGGISWPDYRP